MRVALMVLLLAQDAPKLEQKVKALVTALRQARTSTDPEVRDRAGRILAEMERPTVQTRDDVEAIVLDLGAQESNLRRLIEALGQQSKLQILFTARVEDSGVLDTDIEMESRGNLGLARFLDQLGHAHRLAWTVKSGCILIDLAKPADYGKVNVKFYDIRSLTVGHKSDGMRATSLVDMMAWGRDRVAMEEGVPILSADDVVTLIMEGIDPDVWEESDLYYINMTPNQELLISAPEETHKKIRAYLQGMNKIIGRQWEAKVWMVAVPASRGVRLPEDLGNLQWDALRRQALEGKEASLLGTFRLMGFPEQRVSCVSGTSHMIVRSYTSDGQPQVDEITDGVKMWVTAEPDEGGRTLADIVISSSKILSIEKIATKRGEISLPEMAHTEVRVRRHFPQGSPVILARIPGSSVGKPGQETVLFIATFNSFIPE